MSGWPDDWTATVQDAAVQRLYVYWAGYWFVRQTPARFGVNGDKSRTNNDVKNWNRWFHARCHGHRQSSGLLSRSIVYEIYYQLI
jgi:hypothetical protein